MIKPNVLLHLIISAPRLFLGDIIFVSVFID
nr:MAG TPA: hypothetical protein [Caudoviricetes sp.]DAS58071.1 MAG TPA: hypothetical protein [Caudoviricetes sp.]